MTGTVWRFVATPRAAMALLIAVLLSTVAATLFRYGFAFDDMNGFLRAANLLAFLTSGGTDQSAVGQFATFNFYGAMPDFLALLLQKALPFLGFDSRHLVAGLFGVGGIYYAYRLGDTLAGGWTGPVAAVLLTFNPMWFGYMFINLKDIPFATALLASSYHALRILADEAPPSWRSWVGVGLWSGLLATTKLLGLPMLGVVVVVMLTFASPGRHGVDLRAFALRAAGAAAAALVGVVVCAALFWPQLFLYRPGQLWQVILTFLDFTPWGGKVLLDGAVYPWDQVPRTYLITYFVISMPLAITALYLMAAPLAIWTRRVGVLGPVTVPVVFFVAQAVLHSQVYNGFRHFLFVIPFIAVAAAAAFTTLADIGQRRAVRAAATGLLALFAGVSAYDMAMLFPYQYSSYNLLVGGISGANGRFYVDVWRSAQREALGLLAAAAPPDATYQVFSCGSPLDFAGRPRFRPTRDPAQANYVIALPRGCPAASFPGYRVVAEVKRGGVVFASVLAPP